MLLSLFLLLLLLLLLLLFLLLLLLLLLAAVVIVVNVALFPRDCAAFCPNVPIPYWPPP